LSTTQSLLHELMKLAATDLNAARVRMLAATPQQLTSIIMSFTSSEADLQVAALILIMVSDSKLGSMHGLVDLIVPATALQAESARVRFTQQKDNVATALASTLKAQSTGSHETQGLIEYYFKQIAIREKRKGILDHFLQLNQRATRIDALVKAEAARRAAI
jgi:hypothetical protein